jgi:hypothetical protein
MFTDTQVEELVELLLTLNKNTKIYIGCDSYRFMKKEKKYAKFATVCIVHMNGNNGCRVFSHTSIEPDFDLKANRPKMRMLNEAKKICEAYNQLIPFVDEYDVSVHLDINLDEQHGSNCAAKEAAGFVLGMTGLPEEKIIFKPDAWASSHGADGSVHGRTSSTNNYII